MEVVKESVAAQRNHACLSNVCVRVRDKDNTELCCCRVGTVTWDYVPVSYKTVQKFTGLHLVGSVPSNY